MTEITLQGNKINTNGEVPEIGSPAPDFILVNSDLNDVSLSDYDGKNIILNIIPSLDTPVCQKSTKISDPAGYSFYQHEHYDIEVEADNN